MKLEKEQDLIGDIGGKDYFSALRSLKIRASACRFAKGARRGGLLSPCFPLKG